MEKFTKIILAILFLAILSGCQTLDSIKKNKKIKKDKVEEPSLIDSSKVVSDGQKSMDRKVKEGPKPKILKKAKEVKRKTLTTENV